MLEGLMRALKILKEEHLSNYEEELLMEDLVEKLEGEILNIKQSSYSNKELGRRDFTVKEIKILKELFEVTYEDLLN